MSCWYFEVCSRCLCKRYQAMSKLILVLTFYEKLCLCIKTMINKLNIWLLRRRFYFCLEIYQYFIYYLCCIDYYCLLYKKLLLNPIWVYADAHNVYIHNLFSSKSDLQLLVQGISMRQAKEKKHKQTEIIKLSCAPGYSHN